MEGSGTGTAENAEVQTISSEDGATLSLVAPDNSASKAEADEVVSRLEYKVAKQQAHLEAAQAALEEAKAARAAFGE